jgi:hypothetical protein
VISITSRVIGAQGVYAEGNQVQCAVLRVFWGDNLASPGPGPYFFARCDPSWPV